ncbi:MAG: acetylglutamate kinase [Bacteroidales bacterium]|nr:acetylglutamate kinase [Bacteroidales bacterium]
MSKKMIPEKALIVFKYGGNAMTEDSLKKEVLKNICALKEQGHQVIISHGGGPFIKQALTEAGIKSEFVDGLRKTTPKAFEYVERVLKGKVNSDLVSHLNSMGQNAVGISGKDGNTVIAVKRRHYVIKDNTKEEVDLGRVGDVARVNTSLIKTLLQNEFTPVIACIADDTHGVGFNINGDMFAGHIAGALQADEYIVLTDVDGLLRDKNNPDTLIKHLRLDEVPGLIKDNIIQGGMIPKIDSCITALKQGVKKARIINGTKPDQIVQAVNSNTGTTITQS